MAATGSNHTERHLAQPPRGFLGASRRRGLHVPIWVAAVLLVGAAGLALASNHVPPLEKDARMRLESSPRHGEGHSIYPTAVNFRANVWAMKELGVTHIFAVTAVGSLREEIAPGHLVFPDQFIDRTTQRKSTFYEGQEVCHIPMADPFEIEFYGATREVTCGPSASAGICARARPQASSTSSDHSRRCVSSHSVPAESATSEAWSPLSLNRT